MGCATLTGDDPGGIAANLWKIIWFEPVGLALPVGQKLIGREFKRSTQKNYPGEWDRKIPNKKASSPEWRPSKETVEKNLMQKLGEAAAEFEKAYNLMMKIIGDLEDNYHDGNKKEERKF